MILLVLFKRTVYVSSMYNMTLKVTFLVEAVEIPMVTLCISEDFMLVIFGELADVSPLEEELLTGS